MSTRCELCGAGPAAAPPVAAMLAVVQIVSWERIPGRVDSSNRALVAAWPGFIARLQCASWWEVLLNVRCIRRPLPLAVVVLFATVAATATAATATPRRTVGKPAAQGKAAADTSARHALVIEGDDHLFMVAAPPGWVLDDTAGMGSRIRCVFYPKGQKWATAPTVMYVNPLHGFGAKTRTVTTLMTEDEQAFRHRAPHGTVTNAGTLVVSEKNNFARVRYFSEDGGPPHEAVAYVPDKDLVMLLVLSSHTPQGFQQALGAYRKLVESYAYVGANRGMGH